MLQTSRSNSNSSPVWFVVEGGDSSSTRYGYATAEKAAEKLAVQPAFTDAFAAKGNKSNLTYYNGDVVFSNIRFNAVANNGVLTFSLGFGISAQNTFQADANIFAFSSPINWNGEIMNAANSIFPMLLIKSNGVIEIAQLKAKNSNSRILFYTNAYFNTGIGVTANCYVTGSLIYGLI